MLKVLNKFNGNICFIGDMDSGETIFKCNRENRLVSYAISREN